MKVCVHELVFSNGLSIRLSSGSILVIVGPNNSGKSTALSEIRLHLASQKAAAKVISGLTLERGQTLEEIRSELSVYRVKNNNDHYAFGGATFVDGVLPAWWSGTGPFMGNLVTMAVSELTTRARLSDCDPPQSFDARNASEARHPFQLMYMNDGLELLASKYVRRAFGKDLIVHRASGNKIPLYVGDRPSVESGEDRVSRSYLDKLEQLPELQQQGDGVRSFVSIISRVLAEKRPLQLIDEPEAFLHPPQARLVAENIAEASGERQTFIATHSSDVVQGLLAGRSSHISFVRLKRIGSDVGATYLPNDELVKLWKDPILRYGNALDGLFHDGVIITEADADCRFYEAVSAAADPRDDRVDCHYVYSGGKDRLPVIVSALRRLGVPVATVVDFDVLNNDHPLRKIVEVHGLGWGEVEPDWNVVKSSVEQSEAFHGGDKFRSELISELKLIPSGEAVPKSVLRNIRKLTKKASAWDNVKLGGLAAIAPGAPTQAAKKLLNKLKDAGIFVVPCGEMEGFCRSIGSHGTRWVEQALSMSLDDDPELENARSFSLEILAYIRSEAGRVDQDQVAKESPLTAASPA